MLVKKKLFQFLSLSSILFLILSKYHFANCLNKSNSIGLSLSGGAAKGFAHVGVLKVLEKAKIPIDCITGTSIGSIIGGLYAAGYSAEQIETGLLKLDWQRIFKDIPNRSEILLEDKEYFDRYQIVLPVKNKKISLPAGLYAGQSLLTILGEFSFPIQNHQSFKDYPIPLAILATDLESGQAFLIESGNLHEAMRSSMAIPTAFTPWNYEGHLLVDGLLTRNFPVKDLKEMGANIIIGVDVGAPLYKQAELDSILNIFDQVISLPSDKINLEQVSLTDIYIKPDLEQLDKSNFASVKELIKKGEEAATLALPRLIKLLEEKQIPRQLKPKSLVLDKTYYVKEIKIEGLAASKIEFVKKEANLKLPIEVDFALVKKVINRLYNTSFFETVTYQIKGETLVLKVQEKVATQIGFALHFDTAKRASILANLTTRNLGFHNSRTALSLKFGNENQVKVDSSFFNQHGKKIQTGFKSLFEYNEINLESKQNNFNYINENGYDLISGEILYGTVRSRTKGFGFGLRAEAINRDKDRLALLKEPRRTEDLGYIMHFRKDSLNQTNYPTDGGFLDIKYYVTNSNFLADSDNKFLIAVWEKLLPLNDKLSLQAGFKTGRNTGSNIPIHRNFFLGGFEPFSSNNGFIGVRYKGIYAENMMAWLLGARYKLDYNTVISLAHNEGNVSNDSNDLYSRNKAIKGTGISFAKMSQLGPMELGISHSTEENFYSWLSLGYNF